MRLDSIKPISWAVLFFATLFIVLLPACNRKPIQTYENDEVRRLVDLVRTIKPWQNDTNYSSNDWRAVVEAGLAIQKATSNSVDAALRAFIGEKRNFLDDSKPFLALRVAFNLPTKASHLERFSFVGWTDWRGITNSDGTFNLGWPIGWQHGQPYLISGCEGYEGLRYAPEKEYRYMKERYPFRNLIER